MFANTAVITPPCGVPVIAAILGEKWLSSPTCLIGDPVYFKH